MLIMQSLIIITPSIPCNPWLKFFNQEHFNLKTEFSQEPEVFQLPLLHVAHLCRLN
jgi:hypothetical protein